MRTLTVVIVAVVLLMACAGWAPAQEADTTADENAPLNFRVEGSAEALPDRAIIHYTLAGDAETIGEANKQLEAMQEAVVKSVAKFDVKPAQIEAERFNVVPIQANSGSGRNSTAGSQPLGFRVVKDFKITMPVAAQDVPRLLSIADAVYGQGARLPAYSERPMDYSNQTPAILEFYVAESETLVKAAITDGLTRAKKLAETTAREAGKTKVQVARVQTSQAQAYVGSKMGRSYPGGPPYSTTVWQPVRAVVSMNVSFTCQ